MTTLPFRKWRENEQGEEEVLNTRTYRHGLLSALVNDAWRDIIETHVLRVSRIMHEVSLLLNLHCARVLQEEDDGTPLHTRRRVSNLEKVLMVHANSRRKRAETPANGIMEGWSRPPRQECLRAMPVHNLL